MHHPPACMSLIVFHRRKQSKAQSHNTPLGANHSTQQHTMPARQTNLMPAPTSDATYAILHQCKRTSELLLAAGVAAAFSTSSRLRAVVNSSAGAFVGEVPTGPAVKLLRSHTRHPRNRQHSTAHGHTWQHRTTHYSCSSHTWCSWKQSRLAAPCCLPRSCCRPVWAWKLQPSTYMLQRYGCACSNNDGSQAHTPSWTAPRR